MPTKRQNRKLAAVLSTDAIGYSRLMGQDEARTVNTLKALFEAITESNPHAHRDISPESVTDLLSPARQDTLHCRGRNADFHL